MELPEIEREEIIAQRLEEMQRLQDKRSLDAMVRMQRKDSGGVSGDPDAVAKAAKRRATCATWFYAHAWLTRCSLARYF
jgi:RNA polymerase-associated protein RTF1